MALEGPESEVEKEETSNTANLELTAQQETRALVRHGYVVRCAWECSELCMRVQ